VLSPGGASIGGVTGAYLEAVILRNRQPGSPGSRSP
jgi:hypothetical protein